METKQKEFYLKKNQVWKSNTKAYGVSYEMYYRLAEKNSNNMWRLELLWVKPAVTDDRKHIITTWISKELLLHRFTFVSQQANLETLKVLFG